MILLIGFALIAGFLTCLSPCVLPMLPIVLSGGATGGRRRPLGIVTGLVVSFTFAAIALVYVIAALGLPDDLLRTLAIVVLLLFGVSLIVPAISAPLEAWLSRLGKGAKTRKGNGFWSGVPLGFSLGFIYAPCAGPILASVITVSATQTFTAGRLAVAFAYAIGSAAALYLIMLGGRRLTRRLSSRSQRLQQAMGVLMVVMAVLLFKQVDIRFQTAIASKLPSFLLSPADKLQGSKSIKGPLAGARGGAAAEAAGSSEAAGGHRLPILGTAPEFVDNQHWFNTAGNRPLTVRGLRGRVVLVDFWTYTCINCIRTFPHLRALDQKYRAAGLTIVGVHSPEFPFEKDPGNVSDAISQNELKYPIVQDNNLSTWNAYRNQYWPADYLIDAQGRIRYVHFGEGDYETSEKAVRSLLAEAGQTQLGDMTHVAVPRAAPGVSTPETYLGSNRAVGYANGTITPGIHDFTFPHRTLRPDEFAYAGRWQITPESGTAGRGARLDLNFGARRVFLVLGSPGRSRRLTVLLDGRPIGTRLAGADVHHGTVAVGPQRLYRLVELPRVERHRLTLRFAPGISGYAFTFG
jgi:cytochrome c biogenesis protein CcdA/thiol-disulfide isomerase/thioredoxin